MDREAQPTSTKLRPFDPSQYEGEVAQGFEKFLRLYKCKYLAWDRSPPSDVTDKEEWIGQDMLKQLRGHYATDRFMDDIEAVASEKDLRKMSFDELVGRLRNRYKPTQNQTMAHYKFHRLSQGIDQSFDSFVNEVKKQAKSCAFTCKGKDCSVADTLIRDQVIIGVRDDEFRKIALKEEWDLLELEDHGRRAEAALIGAAKLGEQRDYKVERLKPGKYSRKAVARENMSQQKTPAREQFSCYRCCRQRCNVEKCPALKSQCHVCNKKGHWAGSTLCDKRKKAEQRGRRQGRAQRLREDTSESSSDEESVVTATSESSSNEDADGSKQQVRRVRKVFRIQGVRQARGKKGKRAIHDFQVEVALRGKTIRATTDTGAEINVMPKRTAAKLKLPLEKSCLRISPYGAKPFRVIGKYEGSIVFGDMVTTATWYVVKKKNIEPLISGPTAERFGIIKFNSDPLQKEQSIERIMVDKTSSEETNQWLRKYPKVFEGIGTLKDHEVKLYLDETIKPVAQPPRPVPFHLKKRLEEEINKMERADIIEEHSGPAPWISNIVLAPKEDGNLRVTVDMRQVNKAIKSTNVPIPNIEDIKAQLSGSKYFTKLNLKAAFHQLILYEESRYATVFHANGRLMHYKRLTMGNLVASGELSKALQPVFGKIPNVHLIQDDMIIAAPTLKEHNETVEAVLSKALEVGITFNPEKSVFNAKEVPFWGVIITKEGIKPDPAKVKALHEAERPQNKEELISFLSMLQSNSAFIPRVSLQTQQLRDLTKKHSRFKWRSGHQKEFEQVKSMFHQETLIRYFDPKKDTYIFVDAHRTGLGAVLAQGNSINNTVPIAIASRTTTKVEQRYPQIDLEGLAVDFGLRRFRQYIVGGPSVKVVTDHKPLVSIFATKRLGSIRLDRVKLRHQDITFEVCWQPGRVNPADYASRHATPLKKLPKEIRRESKEFTKLCWFLHSSPYVEAITIESLQRYTENDKVLTTLREYVTNEKQPDVKKFPKLQPFAKIFNELTVTEGGLLFRGERIVLPEALLKRAVDKGHQGGHPGESNLKRRLRMHFWCPGINKAVREKIKACLPCQVHTNKTTKEPQAMLESPENAWDKVALDLFGPMPNGRHILVAQDAFTLSSCKNST